MTEQLFYLIFKQNLKHNSHDDIFIEVLNNRTERLPVLSLMKAKLFDDQLKALYLNLDFIGEATF